MIHVLLFILTSTATVMLLKAGNGDTYSSSLTCVWSSPLNSLYNSGIPSPPFFSLSLVFGYDPEVVAQTGPSPNAGLSTDVYPVTQLIAFFAHAAPLWLCEACPTHVFIPFCLLLLYNLGVFMHLGWITIFPKLLGIFPQLLSVGLLLI